MKKIELEKKLEAQRTLLAEEKTKSFELMKEIRDLKADNEIRKESEVQDKKSSLQLERSRDLIVDIISGEAEDKSKIEVLQDMFFKQVHQKKEEIKRIKQGNNYQF